MRITITFILLLAAAICLVIALLLATNTIHSGNEEAWFVGGVLSFVLSFFPWGDFPHGAAQ